MTDPFWLTLWLSLRLALTTTLALLLLGLPLAYGLAHWRSRWKALLEAVVALPLVLPPTVLGFYLLVAFSPRSTLGGWLQEQLGISLIFSFAGLVVGSIIYSLPFMVQPVQGALEQLPRHLREAAITLGKSRWQTFRYVELPNIRSGLVTGIVLTFAHTLGEFGVILMIGGNIPGATRVASIAIYDQVEALQYSQAHRYALVLLLLALAVLYPVYRQRRRRWW